MAEFIARHDDHHDPSQKKSLMPELEQGISAN
jgi:hypothetical protein